MSTAPDGPAAANDYDGFAEAYAAATASNLVNAHYERPAVLSLAGEVTGRRVLDAGCGAGPLSAELRARGATVTGFDSSAAMLRLARQRLGADADLHLADLREPLPFPDGAFDVVVASLVLHYLHRVPERPFVPHLSPVVGAGVAYARSACGLGRGDLLGGPLPKPLEGLWLR